MLSNLDAGFVPARVPFSRLHLIDVSANANANVITAENGFRPWMRNGVTFTGNSDQSYVGAKYAVNETGAQLIDVSDMVMQWCSDLADDLGPDHLRFIFTRIFTGATSEANGLFGRDSLQLHPHVFIAPGDFDTASRAFSNLASPTERSDLLEATVRKLLA